MSADQQDSKNDPKLKSATEEHPKQCPEENLEERLKQQRTGTSKLQVAQSVGAAMLGVQSSKNRKRDFQTGKPMHFIIGGLVGTMLFILVVWLLVQYVLATS